MVTIVNRVLEIRSVYEFDKSRNIIEILRILREISLMTDDSVIFSEKIVEKLLILSINRMTVVRVQVWNIINNIINKDNLHQLTHYINQYIMQFQTQADNMFVINSILYFIAQLAKHSVDKLQIMQVFTDHSFLQFILQYLSINKGNNSKSECIYKAGLIHLLNEYYKLDKQVQVSLVQSEVDKMIVEMVGKTEDRSGNKEGVEMVVENSVRLLLQLV